MPNELNVLLTHDVRGLYIYAVDLELQTVLDNETKVVNRV